MKNADTVKVSSHFVVPAVVAIVVAVALLCPMSLELLL